MSTGYPKKPDLTSFLL